MSNLSDVEFVELELEQPLVFTNTQENLYKLSNIMSTGPINYWNDSFITKMIETGKSVKGMIYDFPTRNVNFSLDGKYYRLIRSLPSCYDVLFDINVICLDNKKRRFGLTKCFFEKPDLYSSRATVNLKVGINSLDIIKRLLVLEITEEEAKLNSPIDMYFEFTIGFLERDVRTTFLKEYKFYFEKQCELYPIDFYSGSGDASCINIGGEGTVYFSKKVNLYNRCDHELLDFADMYTGTNAYVNTSVTISPRVL